MLTHTDFHKLPRKEQYKYIRKQCLYLASRKEQVLKMRLYYSGTFFIEVESYVHSDRVRLIRTFVASERLVQYVSGIDVQGLLPDQKVVRWNFPSINKVPDWLWAGIVIQTCATLAICYFWLKLF